MACKRAFSDADNLNAHFCVRISPGGKPSSASAAVSRLPTTTEQKRAPVFDANLVCIKCGRRFERSCSRAIHERHCAKNKQEAAADSPGKQPCAVKDGIVATETVSSVVVEEKPVDKLVYPCSICGRTFEQKKGRSAHEVYCRRPNKAKPATPKSKTSYCCRTCGQALDCVSSLDAHERLCRPAVKQSVDCTPTKSSDEAHLPCRYCGKLFKSTAGRGGHEHFCSMTWAQTARLQADRDHVQSASEADLEESAKETFPCGECGRLFFYKSNLHRHRRVVHKLYLGSKRKIDSKGAGKVRNLPPLLIPDQNTSPEEVAKLLSQHRPSASPSGVSKKKKVLAKRPSKEGGLQCPFCPRVLSHPASLVRHCTIHTGQGQPHRCRFCHIGFPSEADRDAHEVNFHTVNTDGDREEDEEREDDNDDEEEEEEEEPAFEGRDEEELTFEGVDEEELASEAGEEEDEEEERYDRKEAEETEVKDEVEEEEGVFQMDEEDEDSPPKKIKLLACEQCPRKFTKPAALVRHCNAHKGRFPHRCWYCSDAFETEREHAAHMWRSHPNVRDRSEQLAFSGVAMENGQAELLDDQLGVVTKDDEMRDGSPTLDDSTTPVVMLL